MRAPTGEEETHPRFDPQERILSTLHAGEIPGLKRYGLEGALDTTHLGECLSLLDAPFLRVWECSCLISRRILKTDQSFTVAKPLPWVVPLCGSYALF